MSTKINSLFIEQFKGFRDFYITFENDLNILVGENGTGKTTVLEIIYNVLSNNKDYFRYNNLTKIELDIVNNDIQKKILVINNDNIIEIVCNGEILNDEDNLFNEQKVLYFPADINYINYSIDGPKKMDEEYKDIKLDSQKLSKDLKQYLVNAKMLDFADKEENKDGNRIEHLKSIYNNFFDDKIFENIDVKNFEPIFKLKESEALISLDKLSLGEKQIFYKGCSLVQYSENKSLVILIDEPESSLHPEWQQKILDFYKNINPNNQYIFATHSPQIVACCNKANVKVIEKEDNILKLKEDIEETYGVDNDTLLYKIFNLESVRNIEIQELIDRYRDLYYRRDFISNEELEELKRLKEKLLSMKGLPKELMPLLELEINTQRLSEI